VGEKFGAESESKGEKAAICQKTRLAAQSYAAEFADSQRPPSTANPHLPLSTGPTSSACDAACLLSLSIAIHTSHGAHPSLQDAPIAALLTRMVSCPALPRQTSACAFQLQKADDSEGRTWDRVHLRPHARPGTWWSARSHSTALRVSDPDRVRFFSYWSTLVDPLLLRKRNAILIRICGIRAAIDIHPVWHEHFTPPSDACFQLCRNDDLVVTAST